MIIAHLENLVGYYPHVQIEVHLALTSIAETDKFVRSCNTYMDKVQEGLILIGDNKDETLMAAQKDLLKQQNALKDYMIDVFNPLWESIEGWEIEILSYVRCINIIYGRIVRSYNSLQYSPSI